MTPLKTYKFNTVAVIGNYLPRKCGIATFTTDLCEGLASILEKQHGSVLALAMNDVPEGYAYPKRVNFEIRANMQNDYQLATDFLNVNQIDIVIVQHEFGIFGGEDGIYILQLLRNLRIPVITTLHTVVSKPKNEQRRVIKELAKISHLLVVMSHKATDILTEVYKVPKTKIVYIPHGIPEVPFVDPNFYKDLFGVEGKKVILTFGLLSPGKGIEEMLKAMPDIVHHHPEAVYVILGATHPHLKKKSGEEYRQHLQQMVYNLNLQEHVMFHDRFVSLEELCNYIGMADIHVTPYLNPQQITSGTLAYSMGAGKAVVSTPYWYAQEMLAEGRGRLVPFNNPKSLSENIIDLFSNNIELNAMRKRAYQFCRKMVWKEVAMDYLNITEEILDKRAAQPQPFFVPQKKHLSYELPEPNLKHLHIMTDDVGILQHAIYATPDRHHGYCTDDNARALISTSLYWHLQEDESVIPLMHTYLAFLNDAFDRNSKHFRNFMSYDRKWLEKKGSEDSHARALWALGVTAAKVNRESILNLSVRLFNEALVTAEQFESPRTMAFTLLGTHAHLERFGGNTEIRRVRAVLSERLFKSFKQNCTDEWQWGEDSLNYANARIPQALILSGQWVPNKEMIQQGLRSLEWLLKIQTADGGCLSVIGNRGWMTKDGTRAKFDQQPIDVMGLVEACAEAYRVTREEHWLEEASRCLWWFLGKNDLNEPLYDFKTGGCCDGLSPNGPNKNQGAESTLAWLISHFTLLKLRSEQIIIDKEQ